jgi:hypothetical protein
MGLKPSFLNPPKQLKSEISTIFLGYFLMQEDMCCDIANFYITQVELVGL